MNDTQISRWEYASRLMKEYIIDYRVDLNEIYISGEWKSLLGYASTEIQDSLEGIINQLFSEKSASMNQRIKQFVDSKEPIITFTFSVRSRSNQQKRFSGKAEKVEWDEHGNNTRIIAVISEILTDPNAVVHAPVNSVANNSSIELNAGFKALFNQHTAVMLLIDPDTLEFIDVNQAAIDFYGYAYQDFCRLKLTDIHTLPEASIREKIELARLKQNNISNVTHRLASGLIKSVEAHISCIQYQGKIVLFAVVFDTTEKKEAERLLLNERDHFQSLVRALPDILFRLDKENRFIFCHANNPNDLLLPESEFMGKRVKDIFPKNISDEFEIMVDKSRKTGEVVYWEYMLELPEEPAIKWFEARIIQSFSQYTLVIIREITDKKNTVELQNRQLQIIETVQQVANIGYFVRDMITGEVNASASNDALFGIEHSFLRNISGFKHLYAPGHINEVKRVFKKAIEEKKNFEARYQIQRQHDHQIRWIKTYGQFTFNEAGIPTQLIGANIDITDMENLLKERERILESISDFFYVLDRNLNFLYCNATTLNNFNLTEKDIVGKHILEVFPVLANTIVNENFVKAMETNEYINFEVFMEDYDTWYEQHFYPFENGCTVIFKKINDRKIAEAQLLKANTELELKTKELIHTNSELERFAYIASHDLQEPLRAIISFLHLLEKKYGESLDETAKKYIHFTIDGAQRMRLLINDLLHYSRAGTGALELMDVNMNEVLQEVEEMFKADLQSIHATIQSTHLPVIQAAKSPMIQVFQNLIGNAIKYRKQTAPLLIKISAVESASEWEFTIEDNGIGIDPVYFEKIFVLFQRLHNSAAYSGTGIGLSVCKKIIERFNGKIGVESEPGNGSVFLFSLPKNPSIHIS